MHLLHGICIIVGSSAQDSYGPVKYESMVSDGVTDNQRMTLNCASLNPKKLKTGKTACEIGKIREL